MLNLRLLNKNSEMTNIKGFEKSISIIYVFTIYSMRREAS